MIESEWNLALEAASDPAIDVEVLRPQFFRRFVRVCRDPVAGPADRAKALQDALRSAACHGIEAPAVNGRELGLEEVDLQNAGLRIERLTGRVVLIDTDLPPLLGATYAETPRRCLVTPPMDAALVAAMGEAAFGNYLGCGQRSAVRLALTAPPGSTLAVQLPTGSGKSLIIHTLAVSSKRDQLVLVIVPTVALAMEQAKRAQEVLRRARLENLAADAYHGGEHANGDRFAIRQRIDLGLQKVIFCSPESAMGSLMPVLFRAARRGQVAAMVVDEAHLVDGWGDEFRPQFQLVPPLFRSLQEASPTGILKVLMSATFTPHVASLLEDLFSETRRPYIRVNGGYLRPETWYSSRKIHDPSRIQDAVVEALWQLPRPLILYVSSPSEAMAWKDRLKGSGHSRVRCFHGETPTQDRLEIIKAWASDSVDIMVATSAFGVGMDKVDVRTVLHAMVPENLDRFYQEAGRGGRDGLASVSQVIWSDAAAQLARRHNRSKLVRKFLGFERWRAMKNAAAPRSDGRMIVDVSQRRYQLHRWSAANQDWNWRTLLLMQRAGMIRLRFLPPRPPGDDGGTEDSEAARVAYFESYFDQVEVEILDSGHLDDRRWESVFVRRRAEELRAREAGYQALAGWLHNPQKPLCEILVREYTVDGHEPQLACGGCPGCMAEGRQPFTPTLGGEDPRCSAGRVASGHHPLKKVRYTPGAQTARGLLRAWKPWIHRLIGSGQIQAIRGSRDTLEALSRLLPLGSTPFWSSLDPGDGDSPWDELILAMPGDATPVLWPIRAASRRILVAPADRTHDRMPYRAWWQEGDPGIELEDFIRSI